MNKVIPESVTLSWEDYEELTKRAEALTRQLQQQNDVWSDIKDLCLHALAEDKNLKYRNTINTILNGLSAGKRIWK